MDKALRANGADCHVETLTGTAATRQGIRETLGRLAAVKPDDAFRAVMIGHGTYDGAEYKFNIPGPDITAEELARCWTVFPPDAELVVNMTSASGDRFLCWRRRPGGDHGDEIRNREECYGIRALLAGCAAERRCRHGQEWYCVGARSVRYAQGKTAAYFQQEKLLATGHAMLDDTGAKGRACADPSPANAQGLLAAAFPVIRPPAEAAAAQKPGKQKLLAKKNNSRPLSTDLKYEKAAMPAEEYKKQLSVLLLQLAQTRQSIGSRDWR